MDLPALHQLSLGEPTGVREAECRAEENRPVLNPPIHRGIGYANAAQDAVRAILAYDYGEGRSVGDMTWERVRNPMMLHVVDGANMFYSIGPTYPVEIREFQLGRPGIPIVVMGQDQFNKVTAGGNTGCLMNKTAPLRAQGAPVFVVTIDVDNPEGRPEYRSYQRREFTEGCNTDGERVCGLIPRGRDEADQAFIDTKARKDGHYQHFYCETDDALATRVWEALHEQPYVPPAPPTPVWGDEMEEGADTAPSASDEAVGYEQHRRNRFIVSDDKTVNKLKPESRSSSETSEQYLRRAREARRQLQSVESLLGELDYRVRIKVYAVHRREGGTTREREASVTPPPLERRWSRLRTESSS